MLSWKMLLALPAATYDLHLEYRWSDARAAERVAMSRSAELPPPRIGVDVYRTAHGNTSLKKSVRTSSAMTRLKGAIPSRLRKRLGALRRR